MLVFDPSTGQVDEKLDNDLGSEYIGWIYLTHSHKLPTFLEKQLHPYMKDKLYDLEVVPKLIQFKNQVIIKLSAIKQDSPQVDCSIVVNDNCVVTIIKNDSIHFFSKIKDTFKENPDSMASPFKVLFTILNAFLNLYLEEVDQISDRFQSIENQVFKWPFENDIARNVYQMKQQLHRFRQLVEPLESVLTKMEDPNFPYREEESPFYLQDLRHGYNRIIQGLDQFFASIDGIFNLQMSLKADHTNTIVKTLTLFSVVFIPMTFIAGVYGMNFKYIPLLKWSFGFPYAIILMFGVGAALAFYFYLKGWWGRSKKQK